jgi:hypothetical protein
VKKQAAEIGWDWPEICAILMWKLKPQGLTITRRDLGALPQDRVLIEERLPDRMNFSFVTVKEAMRIRAPILAATGVKASVSQLSGRWMKLGTVLLWKLCKDKGLTLTNYDRDALPADRILLTIGARNEVVFRWTTRADAARIRKFERDNEGVEILEVTTQ